MAYGKIVADQIQHSSEGTVDTQYVVNGSAKAWLDYSGSGTTFNDSFNASGAVDNGVGDYTYSFISNQLTANYAICSAAGNLSSGGAVVSAVPSQDEQTVSSFNVEHGYTSGVPSILNFDSRGYVSIFGDLA